MGREGITRERICTNLVTRFPSADTLLGCNIPKGSMCVDELEWKDILLSEGIAQEFLLSQLSTKLILSQPSSKTVATSDHNKEQRYLGACTH